MKILFLGDLHTNCGPANVNKQLTKALSDDYQYIRSRKNVWKMTELFWKMIRCNVVVISGVTRIGTVAAKLAPITDTKVVYIMHGCAEFEAQLNGKNKNSDQLIAWETEVMQRADLLLPVSQRFCLWVQERYPQYAHKTQFLFNGMEVPNVSYGGNVRDHRSVIAAGGDRATKNNAVLVQAVSRMDGKAELKVYGTWYAPDKTCVMNHTQYMGVVPQPEFYEELSKSAVFVLNSVFEPFSLAVIDALNYGCSVLVSSKAGIVDLLPLLPEDVIEDPMDVKEIEDKLSYLLEHPNSERLLAGMDYSTLSYAVRAQELTQYCRGLIEKDR